MAFSIPLAGTFSAPTAVGYVELPGLIILLVAALICVACFVLCPRKPLLPKLVALALMVFPIFYALEFLGYDYLHIKYGS
jgi:DMSO reductase anchor subunit